MSKPTAVIFDVGMVLYDWNPRYLYAKVFAERSIDDDRALDCFLRDVLTTDWHFQHDAGRPFAATSAELIAQFPEHEALILAWRDRYLESIGDPIPGVHAIVAELEAAGVPLFVISNFSHEFWPPFRAREASLFDRFQGFVISGEERLIKPDPAIYHLALDRFGLAAEEAFFTDDNAANVAAAAALGIHAHHFTDAVLLRKALAEAGLLDS